MNKIAEIKKELYCVGETGEYSKAKVSFFYDKNNPWKLTYAEMDIDGNVITIPLRTGVSRNVNSTWVFVRRVKNDNSFIPKVTRVSAAECDLVARVAEDILKQEKLLSTYRNFFGVFGRQAEINKRYAQKKTLTREEKMEMLKELSEQNIFIVRLNKQHHRIYDAQLKNLEPTAGR